MSRWRLSRVGGLGARDPPGKFRQRRKGRIEGEGAAHFGFFLLDDGIYVRFELFALAEREVEETAAEGDEEGLGYGADAADGEFEGVCRASEVGGVHENDGGRGGRCGVGGVGGVGEVVESVVSVRQW